MARDTSKLVTIPGELHSVATGNIVTSTEEVFDYTTNKYQKDINQEIDYIKAIGYYECYTPGSTAAKTITTDSSVSLSTKILCKVKFVEKNIVNNATMNINGTGAKALYYNGVRVAANNSWYPNEVVDLYYDGTNYQAKSCADTLEYDVSLHQTHEITETTTTIRTLVFNGDVASNWESETPVSDSSVDSYTRIESNTGQDVDSTTTEGPYATYDSTEDKTNVVYITTHTYTHVVNNYTFDEAVNAVPMSYRHGGLKLRFISNGDSSVQSSDNKYIQARCMAQNFTTDVTQWQVVDDEPTAGSENLIKSGAVAERSVLYKIVSANIHNNADAIASSEIPNFLDWEAHSLSLVSSTRVDFVQNSGGYNLSYYIPVVAGSSYKCTTNIRHLAFFDSKRNLIVGSYKVDTTTAGTEIVAPENSSYIILQYNAESYNPNTVRFGLYADDIDVSFKAITYNKYGKEILLEDSNKIKSIEDSINEVDGKYESIKNNVLFYVQSANIHSSADAVESITQPDGVDWAAHSLNLLSSHAVSFDTNTGSYNLTYYIPVIAGESYKCTTKIRKRAFFNNAKEYVEGSFSDTNTDAGTEIIAPANSAYIIIQYNAENYTPDDVRFGLYVDDIDVPFEIEIQDKYNREIALKKWVKEYVNEETAEHKTITAIGSSGLGLLCGGQYQLTNIQKTTYGVTSDLTLTRVIQILLGYDESNLCAVGGDTASVAFFNSGLSGYIIKNQIELPANKEYTNYVWDTTNIGALMTSELDIVKTTNIFNFTAYVNGIIVEVKPYAGQIKRVDSNEPFTIPANTIITREAIKTAYSADSGTIRKSPINSYGLILQVGANSEGATPEEIVEYYDLAIKASNCKWFVCLAKNGNGTPEPTQAQGGTDLSCAETIELLKRKYGNRFIDHKPYMRSLQALINQGITPTTSEQYPDKDGLNSNPLTATQIANGVKCDMQCIAEGIYPSSFWHSAYRDGEEQTINSSHFNAQGLECMGKFIVEMLNQMSIK